MNRSMKKTNRLFLAPALGLVFLYLLPSALYPQENLIPEYIIQLREKEKQGGEPAERIYTRNDVLYCTGKGEAASANNRAARMMEEGNFAGAAALLEEGLGHASLFLPFRYNLGLCYQHLDRLDLALLHLEKARDLLPEFSRTYLQMGHVYERRAREEVAMNFYKQAVKRNPGELSAYTLIGDIYFKRNQVAMANKYYGACLRHNPRFPDGLLGLAKIHFRRGQYFRAINVIRSIDLKGDYDKALHFYYAECAYKLQDYQTAYDQYRALLAFRNDRFFLTNSMALIRHKLDLTKRFLEK